MNIQQLRCIVEIAHVGSITKAAENLYMNQPNLSRTVIEFENEYATTLFIRNPQGVILTESGKKVVEMAEEILKKSNDLSRYLNNSDKSRINIKIAVARTSYLSLAFCNTLGTLDDMTMLNVSFKECDNAEIINDIMMNGYNIGVIRVPIELETKYKRMLHAKNIEYKNIWKYKYKIAFSKHHPLAVKEKLFMKDLKGYPMLCHEETYAPFATKEELKKLTIPNDSENKILIEGRGSQFDILSKMSNTYMWVSPIPNTILETYNLVTKRCIDSKQEYLDVLIYSKNYSLTDFEKLLIENIFELKYKLEEQNEF